MSLINIFKLLLIMTENINYLQQKSMLFHLFHYHVGISQHETVKITIVLDYILIIKQLG